NAHAFKTPAIERKKPGSIRPEILVTGKELDLNFKVGPESYVSAPDTVISWVPPIEVGDTLTAEIPIKFNGVGEFIVQLLEMDNTKDVIRMMVSVVINEEGELMYMGQYPTPDKYPLKAHHYVFGQEIQARVEGKSVRTGIQRQTWPEPFDIDMTFSPKPEVGKRTIVDLSISPLIPDVKDLQYQIIGATNLQIDSLSSSPGTMPENIDRFEVSFQMIPQKTGRSYISFEIFAHRPDARHSSKPFSRIDYHLVLGSDSSLLYMGEVDPFAVGFETGNPAYEAIDEIANFAGTLYGEKVYRSEPDYEYNRINEQRIIDSIEAGKLIDTLETGDQE
ncbi:MAG: hypothetical protein GWO41_08530, partial [candidate division Zixibacteria bacterium]|nr:hypothetical protein [candidate division Zixibacteria bacterium]NIT52765.1 hypothetical protein [candidate division Zixibacteria bacterium]NIW40969.1 hypothetical protein [candidate division Zixibacteria bacterium]NIX59298.1 hypothetical protein [candidate division Zixibacteria bacterium]